MENNNNIHSLIEGFIQEERNTVFNPFLSTRILAIIDKNTDAEVTPVFMVWKTALLAFSLVVAVFAGITTGNLYQTKNNISDVVLMNDNQMENFDIYIQLGND
jgi:hypothetical protein